MPVEDFEWSARESDCEKANLEVKAAGSEVELFEDDGGQVVFQVYFVQCVAQPSREQKQFVLKVQKEQPFTQREFTEIQQFSRKKAPDTSKSLGMRVSGARACLPDTFKSVGMRVSEGKAYTLFQRVENADLSGHRQWLVNHHQCLSSAYI